MLAVTPRSRLAGTTGLEPAASRSTTERSARLSYAPEVRGWDSNPRSRAHEAREDSHSSTAHRALCKQVWPAGVEPAIFCHPSTACCLCDRQGSNLRRLAFQASALPAELRSHEHGRSRSRTGGLLRIREALCRLSYPPTSGRGWNRTSGLLLVRQALLPAELLARRHFRAGLELRDKGSNLDLHVQSVVSSRLDDPGT
jgi:hypothetical protein